MNIEIIKYGEQEDQFFELYVPENLNGIRGMASVAHGGFFKKEWDLGCIKPVPEHLCKEYNLVVCNTEYRRYEGKGSTHVETIQDIYTSFQVLVETVHNMGLKNCYGNISLVGHSAGGYLVLKLMEMLLKDQNPLLPKKVFGLAPLTDLARAQNEKLSDDGDAVSNWAGGLPQEILEVYKELMLDINIFKNYFSRPKSRIYIYHGDDDIDVPVDHSKEFCEKVLHFGSFLHTDNFDHYDVVNPDHQIWKQIGPRIAGSNAP